VKRLALTVCSLALAWGCGKKHGGPAAEVTGLAAVPASTEIVISADVPRIFHSELVTRAVDQLMLRDPDLADDWQKLHERCKLDADTIAHVLLAIGPRGNQNGVGTGPVLMVATGKITEAELTSCVRGMVGSGGGEVTAKTVAGHTLYQARDGSRIMFFVFGHADTVLLSSNEAFITEALTPGKKATDNPELAAWIALADQKAPLWAAGRMDPNLRDRLVKLTDGQLSAGPSAITIAFDPTAGAKLDIGGLMANPTDTKTLELFTKKQMMWLGMAAQQLSAGKLVDKIEVSSTGNVVHLRVNLDAKEVNQLISALDGGGSAAQDSPPPGSGSGSGP
jgi:hypothetical protein